MMRGADRARRPRSAPFVAACLVVLVIGATAPATAHEGSHTEALEPAVIVEPEDDRSVTISLRSTYDLTDDADRKAFESIAEDTATRERAADRFEERMQRVMADVANTTDRDPSVTNASIAVHVEGDTGIVTFAVTIEALAGARTDRLVIDEPFASGFDPDRPLIVRLPADYRVASASPTASAERASGLTWSASTELDDFEVVLEPADRSDADRAGQDRDADSDRKTPAAGPGVGVLAALFALVAAVGLRQRRSQ